mgnify:CR=1 FL=1
MRESQEIPASMINLRIAIAESFGANRANIIKDSGLTEEILSAPSNPVTVEATMAVWQSIVRQTNSDDVGLISGSMLKLQTAGVLGYVMMNSPSIMVAFEKLSAYQRLVAAIMYIDIIPQGDTTLFEWEMQQEWDKLFRYTVDFAISATIAMVNDCSAGLTKPIKVGFNFSKPSNYETYSRIFPNSELEFGCKKPYILYNRKSLEGKVAGSDSEMFRQFESKLKVVISDHDSLNHFTRATRKFIEKQMIAEAPRIEDVAQELAVSVRSLQGNLKNEGTTFQTILSEVRKSFSIEKLKNQDLNVSDVAFLSGYSDISVFSRNFKKWTGLTPTQFQAQF